MDFVCQFCICSQKNLQCKNIFFQLECPQQEWLWKSFASHDLYKFVYISQVSAQQKQKRVSIYCQNLLIFGAIIIEEEPNKWKKIIGDRSKDTQDRFYICHLWGSQDGIMGEIFKNFNTEFKQIVNIQTLTYACSYSELLKLPTKGLCLHNVLLCIFR